MSLKNHSRVEADVSLKNQSRVEADVSLKNQLRIREGTKVRCTLKRVPFQGQASASDGKFCGVDTKKR